VQYPRQAKDSAGQAKPLDRAAAGACPLGKLKDLAVTQSQDSERDPGEKRTRHEDQMDQGDWQRDQGGRDAQAEHSACARDSRAR
jgi:hypothetical protein